MTHIQLKTGIWYDEKVITLEFPDDWDVRTHWPTTPHALSDEAIVERLEQPIGCPSISEQMRGKQRVVVIVDDLSRPTPAYRVLPHILKTARDGGIPTNTITIVIATGTHGSQDHRALEKKLGSEAWHECQIEVHDDLRNVKHIGKTSYGTPVYVSRKILDADLLLGVGGVYPQHSTGFGGGGKLALGICGRQTIMGLHGKHKSMEGAYNTDNDFRKDVCEIANMIGLTSTVTLHIDAFSNVVNAMFGHPDHYYDSAAAFSKDCYSAPVAHDADLVIANAYPLDISFTFMRKGYKPLATAPREAVKLIVVGAREGVGVHGLFQYINPSPLVRTKNLMIRALSMNKKELIGKIANRLTSVFHEQGESEPVQEKTTILPPNTEHLYVLRTDPGGKEVPHMENVTVMDDFRSLLDEIRGRHFSDAKPIRVRVYPCAPIQCVSEDG